MTRDLETLQQWLKICLLVAAICTTAFPLLWAWSPWWQTLLGRLMMLQAIAFAAAVDITAFFQYYGSDAWFAKHILFIFWLNAIVFALIALATLLLTVTMARMNWRRHKRKREINHG